ncbi:MAG: NADH-quinone oxidoreductase subunit A [Deltaproteobacteria bacterium]|nr:NADH-quinone oxidoreductase subunit A [Deltaproteobacteria bacterium]
MAHKSLIDLLYVAAFFLGGLGFAVGPLVLANIMAPRGTRNVSNKSKQAIECGMTPIGGARVRFGAVYYLYALMFLAFDVDVLFLFPVAVAYNHGLVIRDFIELVIFVGILSLAIIYAWRKGVFQWNRKIYNRQ